MRIPSGSLNSNVTCRADISVAVQDIADKMFIIGKLSPSRRGKVVNDAIGSRLEYASEKSADGDREN